MKKIEVIQRIKDIGIIPVVRASSEEEAITVIFDCSRGNKK